MLQTIKMPIIRSLTHCQVAASQPHRPKLVKEYACPSARNEENTLGNRVGG